MDHDRDNEAKALIELGVASTDTRGAFGEMIEPMGLWHKTGFNGE